MQTADSRPIRRIDRRIRQVVKKRLEKELQANIHSTIVAPRRWRADLQSDRGAGCKRALRISLPHAGRVGKAQIWRLDVRRASRRKRNECKRDST